MKALKQEKSWHLKEKKAEGVRSWEVGKVTHGLTKGFICLLNTYMAFHMC